LKNYLKVLAKTLLPTLGGLIVANLLAAIAISIFLDPPPFSFQSLAEAGLMAIFTGAIAAIPAFVWGAPMYALAAYKNKASYLSAALIGAAPGLLMVLIERSGFTEMCLYYGFLIGICTHFVAKLTALRGNIHAAYRGML
jgi:hypothetical protein